jgi:hypothetical protein
MHILETVAEMLYHSTSCPSPSLTPLYEHLKKLSAEDCFPDQERSASVVPLLKGIQKVIEIEMLGSNNQDTSVNTVSNDNTLAVPAQAAASNLPHIMISYAWKKNKELVEGLCTALRKYDYDVWRDEEGSKSVPGVTVTISEDIIAAMIRSCGIVICVSSEYLASSICKKEFFFADRLKKKLKYVLMDEMFRDPLQLANWLGFEMIDYVYLELFGESDVVPTAKKISDYFKEGIITSESVQPTSPLVIKTNDKVEDLNLTHSISIREVVTPPVNPRAQFFERLGVGCLQSIPSPRIFSLICWLTYNSRNRMIWSSYHSMF